MSSSISAARLFLFGLLQAGAVAPGTLNGVQVTFGFPEEDEAQEVVALLGITSGDEEIAVMGPQAKREELYRIELAVKVYDPTSSDSKVVDTRGFALYEAVRELVIVNTTLGGAVRTAYPVNPRSDGAIQPVDGAGGRLPGWVIRVDVSIECHARA